MKSRAQGQQQGKGFFFLIQVEGAAQECSSGSESRHPDGRQMLENISEQHVHFSWEDLSNIHKHSQVHTSGHRVEFYLATTHCKNLTIWSPGGNLLNIPAGRLLEISLNRMCLIRHWAGHVAFEWAAYRTGCAHWAFTDCSHKRLLWFT